MNRRSFMQVFGLGGMGLIIAEPDKHPLFGKKTPNFTEDLLRGHIVVRAKPTRISRVPVQGNPLPGVSQTYKINKAKSFSYFDYDQWSLYSERFSSEGNLQELHLNYYRATREIRERFAEISLNFLKRKDGVRIPERKFWDSPIPENNWNGRSIVTLVDTEAHLVMDETDSFRACCHFRQYVIPDSARKDFEDYECYSEFGEYPIEVPKDIDFSLLIKAEDKALIEGQDFSSKSIRSILKNIFA